MIIKDFQAAGFFSPFVTHQMLCSLGSMNKRPLIVTVLSWSLIAAGFVGLAYHLTEFEARGPFQYELVWVSLVRLAAIVFGAFMLRGHNWARWLSLVWLAGHVVLSAFHSISELVMHGLLLAVFAYSLFRPGVTEYFRGPKAERNDPLTGRSAP